MYISQEAESAERHWMHCIASTLVFDGLDGIGNPHQILYRAIDRGTVEVRRFDDMNQYTDWIDRPANLSRMFYAYGIYPSLNGSDQTFVLKIMDFNPATGAPQNAGGSFARSNVRLGYWENTQAAQSKEPTFNKLTSQLVAEEKGFFNQLCGRIMTLATTDPKSYILFAIPPITNNYRDSITTFEFQILLRLLAAGNEVKSVIVVDNTK